MGRRADGLIGQASAAATLSTTTDCDAALTGRGSSDKRRASGPRPCDPFVSKVVVRHPTPLHRPHHLTHVHPETPI